MTACVRRKVAPSRYNTSLATTRLHALTNVNLWLEDSRPSTLRFGSGKPRLGVRIYVGIYAIHVLLKLAKGFGP
jgi:hypothetical protein